MAYESVKNQIDAYIKANGVNLITGPVLNAVLTAMLDELGEGYAFQGVLNTTDTPSPAADIPQAWLASAGTYLGGSITVDEDELALIIHTADGWSKETVYRGVQLSYEAIVSALEYTPASEYRVDGLEAYVVENYQPKLESGENIKTIGGESILGEGDIPIRDLLNSGYLFAGIATPSTNPGTPDQNVFYLAGVGIYPNFGGTNITDGYIGCFAYNGSWVYAIIDVCGERLNDFEAIINVLAYSTQVPAKITYNDWVDGYVTSSGVIGGESSYKHVRFPVKPGDNISAYRIAGYPNGISFRYLAYLSNGIYQPEKGFDVLVKSPQIVPDGVDECVATIASSYFVYAPIVERNTTQSEWHSRASDDIQTLAEIVNGFDARIEDVENGVSELSEKTLVTKDVTEAITHTNWAVGYVTDSGVVSDSSRYRNITIECKPGEILDLFRNTGTGNHIDSARFIAAYSNNIIQPSKGGGSVPMPFTVPDDIDKIIISIPAVYFEVPYAPFVTQLTTTQKIVAKSDVQFESISEKINKQNHSYSETFDLSANTWHNLAKNYMTQVGYRVVFRVNLASLTGEIKLSKGERAYISGVGVDGTNLYQYFGNMDTKVRMWAHGLTIQDYLCIVLEMGYTYNCKCTIATNGGRFTHEIPNWQAFGLGCGVLSTINALPGCKLTYRGSSLNEKIWAYGDSYFSVGSEYRWTYYLLNDGYRKYSLNGFPGRSSISAMEMLKNDLELATPSAILWCMGMNDPDSANGINTNWLSCAQELISICNTKGIELFLSTIPNTPTQNNTYKNAWVKANAEKYVDFAKAVGAESLGSSWFPNMLNADQVHPDPQGAIALYEQAITDCTILID